MKIMQLAKLCLFLSASLISLSSFAQSSAEELKAITEKMNALEKEIQQSIDQYNAKPTRRYFRRDSPESVRRYVSEGIERIARIGTLRYPEEARGKIYGTALVEYQVASSGHVISTSIIRSSGFQVLDDAAIRAVQVSSPFNPFPVDVKKFADILIVNMTFNFEKRGG